MTLLLAAAAKAVEVVTFKDAVGKFTENSGSATLAWLLVAVLLLAFAGVGFKPSKRTHLD